MKAHDLIKKIGEIVDEKMATQLEPVNKRLGALEKGQRKQGKDISYIRQTLDVTIDHFDKRDIKLQKRVDKIEDKLRLSSL